MVAERNGLPIDRITEVRILDPYFHMSLLPSKRYGAVRRTWSVRPKLPTFKAPKPAAHFASPACPQFRGTASGA